MTITPVSKTRTRLPGVLLLAAARGKKNPTLREWQNIQPKAMDDPVYLDSLNHGGNLGVLLGPVSGGLIALDFDRQEDADAFEARNPHLAGTFRTCGARGCQMWFYIRGEVPASGDLKDATGRKVCEVRSAGRQSIVWGIHPDGQAYRWLVDAPPAEIAFDEFSWPEGWVLPGQSEPEDPALIAERKLIVEHGEPFTRSEKGKLTLNSMYFVARFARPGDVIYEPGEGRFYAYHTDTGLWRHCTEAALKVAFADMLKEYAATLPEAERSQIINARTERTLAGLLALLQGYAEQRDAFRRQPGVIHVANGMLHIGGDKPELRPFDLCYRSRNMVPVAYDPVADCPRFKRELLTAALDPDDVSLIQRHFGACMSGGNRAQKILVATGTAGGGKSTLVEILERQLGIENVGQLRTEHLAERFEIARFVGRTLLCGKDVPGRFLEESGAHALKALVGHDLLDGERKGSNASFPVRGDFGVVITCNSRLRVRLDGDADAWRRRLLIVKYERPKPERPERNFADVLLAEEGSGILRWMVEGARLHMAELAECGDFRLTLRQRQRVDALLAESDSVREFIRHRVEACDGADVAVFELIEAYTAFCDEMGWEPLSSRRVENALADAMQELRRAARRNGIERGGSAKRGFVNVRLVPGAVEAAGV